MFHHPLRRARVRALSDRRRILAGETRENAMNDKRARDLVARERARIEQSLRELNADVTAEVELHQQQTGESSQAGTDLDREEIDIALVADLREELKAVGRGLIPIVRVRGRPSGPWTIEDRMRHHDVPGVQIAVIEGGEVAWTAGYGELERGSGRCVDERSRFQAASISKPVTALAVLRLVDRGALSLDQPVNERLRSWRVPENEFTVARPVTLRALLSHTAGTTVSGFPGYASGVELPSLRQILEGEPPANTPAVRVDSPVGERFRYSGGGTTIVQLLLTEVVGQPFPELMRDLVLAPLGMRDSTFAQPLPSGLRASAATAHERGAPVSGGWNTYPEMAAAGLWTTAEDLGRFVIGLQQARRGARGSLLSPERAREMLLLRTVDRWVWDPPSR